MLEITAAQMRQVEADCYHCLTNMLDKAQVCSRAHEGERLKEWAGVRSPAALQGHLWR